MIKFKLKPGDIIVMDNYRTLHGRTSYNMSIEKDISKVAMLITIQLKVI